ncbi:MAG: hypothetical protein K6B40_03570 [Firmicutes bacterium]|nr:hypothetical protein [Bacillota bacterium]
MNRQVKQLIYDIYRQAACLNLLAANRRLGPEQLREKSRSLLSLCRQLARETESD